MKLARGLKPWLPVIDPLRIEPAVNADSLTAAVRQVQLSGFRKGWGPDEGWFGPVQGNLQQLSPFRTRRSPASKRSVGSERHPADDEAQHVSQQRCDLSETRSRPADEDAATTNPTVGHAQDEANALAVVRQLRGA